MKVESVRIIDENNSKMELNGEEHLVRCLSMEWEFNGILQNFAADKTKDQFFIPFLTPSRNEMVLFLKNFERYPQPCNVIIINGDSTLRHHLCPPELISDEYLKHQAKVGKEKASNSKYFVQPAIYADAGKRIFTLWIGFGIDWYEVREIELVTGQFGKCLRTARL